MSMNTYEFTKYVQDLEGFAKERWKDQSFRWFKNLWQESEDCESYKNDKFNFRMYHWIPDCVNTYYRYVVDVKPKGVKNKELEDFCVMSGYKYFRVTFGVEKELSATHEAIKEIRKMKDSNV